MGIQMIDRYTWLGVPEINDAGRTKKTMDDFRREYFENHFPKLGEWIMREKPDWNAQKEKLRTIRKDLWEAHAWADADEEKPLAEAIHNILMAEQHIEELMA